MPFDFVDYEKKCNGMTTEQLDKEWNNYTRQIAGGSTSTATSVLLSVFTGGVSLIGLGLSAPRIHNARKKREIIQAGLEARGTTHHTRAKDVLLPMAVVGAAGGITLGLGVSGAEFIPTSGGSSHSAVDYIATHAAASGTATYYRYKGRELAQRKEDEAFEAGIQSSQTLPQGAPNMEKVGPQLPPMFHDYSNFGHPDVVFFEEHLVQPALLPNLQTQAMHSTPLSLETLPMSPPSVSETASEHSVDVHSSERGQNVRSLSLPVSTQSIRRKQVARTQSDHPRPLQSIQK